MFAALAGSSHTIAQIVGFRAGWGLGNALFIGIATGPLVGGLLGSVSWRGPFFGVSALMAIAFIGTSILLPETPPPPRHTSLADPFRALRHRSLLTVGVTALLYNFGFFTMLAYAPFPLGEAPARSTAPSPSDSSSAAGASA